MLMCTLDIPGDKPILTFHVPENYPEGLIELEVSTSRLP